MGRKNSKKRKKEKNAAHEQTLKGVIDITRSGMGFVIVENLPVDVIVRPGDLNTALHGDLVLIKITEDKKGGRRMQGIVTDVLRRKQTEFMGKMEISDDGDGKGFGFFVPESDKPMPDVYVPKQNLNGAKDKNRVIVRMLEWDKSGKRPLGEVVSVLEKLDSNDVAMKEILLENGFPLEFPDDAMEEAARIPDQIGRAHV